MIIVTGGAGFVGSNLVHGLNAKGHDDILIVDDLGGDERFKNLNALRFADYHDKLDFLHKIENQMLEKEEITAVFHIGACADTMEYNANYMMKNNFEYSKKLLHFCLRRRIPFLYASSASVYGNGINGFAEQPQCENALNIYAFSKLMFDRYVRRILPQASSQIVGLRYFNVFGPQENHKGKMASIVYQLYNQVKQTGRVKLFKGIDGYGDGEQKRDFIYVKDVVKVNLWFWENHGAGGIYNCGTGQARTFNALAQAVLDHFRGGQIEYIDFPEILKGKYQNFTQADPSRLLAARYDGGFHSLEDGIAEYCRILDDGGYFTW
jgi:ADP-L-glycero-D-manno-heptose 6-epimerase